MSPSIPWLRHLAEGRVFVSRTGAHGNAVLVLLCTRLPPAALRQEIARGAPAPATVFVDVGDGAAHVHNHLLERSFAGHPLLGAAAVLHEQGYAFDRLTVPAGTVTLWSEDARMWLRAPAAWCPATRHRRLDSPRHVEALPGPPADEPVQVWAWLDRQAGTVRARQFAPSEGKPEDEACGSASMLLAHTLGRPLTVIHGKGSVIHVRPEGPLVALGGRCLADAVRADDALGRLP
ncbi:PhzF family phenazine biosynthesis protein [[Actinomadura] parvosata]|uniref:PhzF family phenazine biosynthesis protein n=1 Tax=[Actinomadura] parvosata TaxID=1955412 RepID=UPI00406C6E80